MLGVAGPVADLQSQSDQFRNQITLVGVAPTAPVNRSRFPDGLGSPSHLAKTLFNLFPGEQEASSGGERAAADERR